MVLNMGNTPYVVIVNEKSDEGQKVLEALEENIEKMDIGSHRAYARLYNILSFRKIEL